MHKFRNRPHIISVIINHTDTFNKRFKCIKESTHFYFCSFTKVPDHFAYWLIDSALCLYVCKLGRPFNISL
jgi:hypothetical protein